MADDDAQLYAAWAAGDKAAGGRLLDRHLASVIRFFTNKVGGAAEADDLVAETFELCARKLGAFRGEGSFRAYLFGIAHNCLRQYYKKKVRRDAREVDPGTMSVMDLGPSPASVLGEHKEQTLLLHALRRLPLDHQVALELMYFEGLSRREIALALDIPEGTVAGRVRKGRDNLEKELAALADDPALLASTVSGLEDWAKDIRIRVDAG